MHACPSCSAPLDHEGICRACGSLARGFFADLDLGPPQIATAVSRGLDFYRLLDVSPADDTRTIARRYRRLRVLFPDDPSRLAPGPARKLQLLEVAGRVLSHAGLRSTYDAMRSRQEQPVRLGALRCSGCGAPFEGSAGSCTYCGTQRPAEPRPPAEVPKGGSPAAEPVDYYAALGLTAEHLTTTPPRQRDGSSLANAPRAPRPDEIDEAANTRQYAILLAHGLDAAERDDRLEMVDIARRMLRDERRRAVYDALLLDFARGRLGANRLDAFNALQDTVRAELREERGMADAGDAVALIAQARGLLASGMAQDALQLVRRVLNTGVKTPAAYQAYLDATLACGDVLALGSQSVRLALDAVDALGRGNAQGEPSGERLFWKGLLERQEGNTTQAASTLKLAAERGSPAELPVWRALAAIALGQNRTDDAIGYCRQALAHGTEREPVLVLLAAACLRARQRNQAREVAAQIAVLRGDGWNADTVLQEIGG